MDVMRIYWDRKIFLSPEAVRVATLCMWKVGSTTPVAIISKIGLTFLHIVYTPIVVTTLVGVLLLSDFLSRCFLREIWSMKVHSRRENSLRSHQHLSSFLENLVQVRWTRRKSHFCATRTNRESFHGIMYHEINRADRQRSPIPSQTRRPALGYRALVVSSENCIARLGSVQRHWVSQTDCFQAPTKTDSIADCFKTRMEARTAP